MADKIKLADSELKEINNLRQRNQEILLEFGQISVARKNLNEREESIDKKLTELKKKEQELLNKLQNKYSNGSIDLNEGVFIPDNSSDGGDDNFSEDIVTAFDNAAK